MKLWPLAFWGHAYKMEINVYNYRMLSLAREKDILLCDTGQPHDQGFVGHKEFHINILFAPYVCVILAHKIDMIACKCM
jgi:hypothetical protein